MLDFLSMIAGMVMACAAGLVLAGGFVLLKLLGLLVFVLVGDGICVPGYGTGRLAGWERDFAVRRSRDRMEEESGRETCVREKAP
ncbi:MAG: hypothetical protein ACLU7D_08835 [Collinsella sp.]